MAPLWERLQTEWENLLRLTPRFVLAAAVLVLAIWLGRLAGRAAVRFLERGHFSSAHRHFFGKMITGSLIILGLAIALNLAGLKGVLKSLLAGGGITAVVLGFAFREIGENFLAGFLLAFDRQFNVGDLIASGDLKGVVRSIELRYTHIRTEDGRDIYIPSAQIFKSPLVNFTHDGLLRPSFTVGIDYDDDAEKARNLLLAAVRDTPGVLNDPNPAIVTRSLATSYVELEVWFWVDTFDKSHSLPKTKTSVMENCQRTLLTHGFTVSANVFTNLGLKGLDPLVVKMEPGHILQHDESPPPASSSHNGDS